MTPECPWCGEPMERVGYREYMSTAFCSEAVWDGERFAKGEDWQTGSWEDDFRVILVRPWCLACGRKLDPVEPGEDFPAHGRAERGLLGVQLEALHADELED